MFQFSKIWIRTINHRPSLTIIIILYCAHKTQWDVKEPTHYLQRVGHVVSCVVIRPHFILMNSLKSVFEYEK